MSKRTLRDVGDLRGVSVMLRAGLNVPVKGGVVVDDYRLARAKRTLSHLVLHGARVILVGHIGRESHETLRPVADAFAREFDLHFVPAVVGSEVRAAAAKLTDGQVLMLENVRQHPGETENDTSLARELASLAELYVLDAFADAHRAHASLAGVPHHVPSCLGLLIEEEVTELSKAATPSHPALFMLGGAKFETKQPLIEKYLDDYDYVFVGGALANDFYKGLGYEVGVSKVSDVDLSGSVLLSHPKLILPLDVTVRGPRGVRVVAPTDVSADEKILDAGPETVRELVTLMQRASSVLWNGPLGNYEEGFNAYTEELAHALAASGAHSIVGGGDTVASIAKLQLVEQFGFVSTGGGAMLEFLEKGTLPAIDAIQDV